MDETSLSLHPPLRRCWMKRGQRKLIPAPGSPKFLHVFGAYNWRSSQVAYLTTERKNTDTFIAFLEHLLLRCYPTQKLVLVLDNASYHRSKAALAAIDIFTDRLRVVWLPKYSPFMNPIERFWLLLKNRASANCLHTSLGDLDRAIHNTVALQNDLIFTERFIFAKHFRLLA